MSKVEDIISPAIEAMGFELVRLRFTGGDRATLQIMAERPDGRMSVDDCAEISRTISVLLDVEDPIDGEYMLEVSSPGIDRPLTRHKDFERFAGHLAKFKLARPIDGRRKLSGIITQVSADTVTVESDEVGQMAIAFGDIAEAQLVITDALIRDSLKNNPPDTPDTPDETKLH